MTADRPLRKAMVNADRTSVAPELRPTLDDLFRRHDPPLGRIVRLACTPFAERTSFHLADLEIELEDGAVLHLLLKDLGLENLHETARRVKPRFLYEPRREIETYRRILSRLPLDTAHFYGAVIKPDAGLYWLLLEKIPGVRLNVARDQPAWLQAARWLARLHSRIPGESEPLSRSVPLLRYDVASYRLWLERAKCLQFGALTPATKQFLVSTYERAIERLIRLPSTFVHGEFYASNILVQETPAGYRIRPVDWEMAAVGPGLMDLAALSAGGWADRDRAEMAAAYHEALLSEGGPASRTEDMALALDDCRLHLAFRWLGWARDWSPPPENVHDWLGEAIALGEKLKGR